MQDRRGPVCAVWMLEGRDKANVPLALLAFLLAYLYFYGAAAPLFGDPDVPWHIATGDLIRSIGAIPVTDSWSFTADGQPWYIISWLWDVLISVLHQGAGTAGLFVFAAALSAGLVGLLASNLGERKDAGTDAIILTLLLATLSLIGFAAARPQLAGYVFILVYHRLLHRSRSAASMRALFWLPVVMALWVNMHGSFIAGFSLTGAYALEAAMLRRWQWFKQLCLIGATCALAALCNPYGIDMYLGVWRTLNSAITSNISEWLPFVLGDDLGTSAWFVMFVLASGMRDHSIPIADRIVAMIWWLAMLVSTRNASIFILVSAPYVAINAQRWVEALDSIRKERADLGNTLARDGMARKLGVAVVGVVAASMALLPVLRGDTHLVSPNKDPRNAIAYLREHYPAKRFLSDYTLGGLIIYSTRGAVPVFVDGRAGTAYPEEVLNDYMDLLKLNDGWEKLAERYRLNGIMIARDQPFDTAYASGRYHGEWREVYRDRVASIFVRK